MSRELTKMNLIAIVQQLPEEDIEVVQVYIGMIERENNQLKERINKIDKCVSSLSSTGRGCEIYADVKREILKVVRGDSK